MKRFVIACVCLLAACAVPKGFTDKECEVIASQSGAVMRLCRIGDRADSLFLRRKAAPLGAEELKSEYFRRLKQGMLLTVRDTADEGVGIAAPQVGVLRRAVIVLETNVPDEKDEYMIELINPVIVETAGEQVGAEGCLSVPDEYGIVARPDYVKVRAQDRHGEWFEVEGHGLTARAFCHELDHLDGVLFIDKATRMLAPEELEQSSKR